MKKEGKKKRREEQGGEKVRGTGGQGARRSTLSQRCSQHSGSGTQASKSQEGHTEYPLVEKKQRAASDLDGKPCKTTTKQHTASRKLRFVPSPARRS